MPAVFAVVVVRPGAELEVLADGLGEQEAFGVRAGWNCRNWTDGQRAEVFRRVRGRLVLVDRVQLMANALGVPVAALGRLS